MSVDDAHGVLLVPPEQLELPSAAAFAFAVGPDTGRGLLDPAAWPEWAVIWYAGMCGLAVVNLAAYTAVAGRQKFAPDDQITAYQRRMRHLGLLVVLPSSIVHCLAPCQQLGRYVWWDTALCSILVSRGLTVIAELCLVAQVATGLLYCENEIFRAKYGPSDPGNFSWHFLTQGTVKAMIFLAVVAQGFSICGTATQRYLWFACKEYCWGLAFLLTAPVDVYVFGEARRLKRVARSGAPPAPAGCCAALCCRACDAETLGLMLTVFCAVYLPWAFIADAPLYLDHWQDQRQDQTAWIPDLDSELSGFRDGLWEALFVRVFSRDWEVWWPALVFRSAHFSMTCWAAVAMSAAPRLGVEQLDRASYSCLHDAACSVDAAD